MNILSGKSGNLLKQVSVTELEIVLKKNGFNIIILNSEKEVKDFINLRIPDNSIVGLGSSITTCKLNVRSILNAKGSIIYYSWDGSENYNRSLDTFDTLQRPEYYITRITAVALSGDVLMKDYSRSASQNEIYPKQVLGFAGINRVVDKLEKRESLKKYTVIKQCSSSTNFTIALLPFLDY
jgi:hypothetical protein